MTVRQFHDGMMVKVLDDGDRSLSSYVRRETRLRSLSDPFQYCIFGYANWILRLPGRNTGQIMTDGGLFNLRRLKCCYKGERVIRDVLFAYDCALNASTDLMIQHEVECFPQGCDNLGLQGTTLDNFIYLGGTLQEWFKSMSKSTARLLRPRSPSEDSLRIYEGGGASASPLTWRATVQWYWPLSSTPARLRTSAARQVAQPFPPELLQQTSSYQMVRQKSWRGGCCSGRIYVSN